MALRLATRVNGESHGGAPAQAAADVPRLPDFGFGAITEEERGIIDHLNAITADALPDHHWHRFGPGWRAYYHLVLRADLVPAGRDPQGNALPVTPQAQALHGALGDDAYEKLAQGFGLPHEPVPPAEIVAHENILTAFFTEATTFAPDSRPGEPPQAWSGERRAVLDPGSPAVQSGGFLQKWNKGGHEIVVGNANTLPWLQMSWHEIKQNVDAAFASPVAARAPAHAMA